ncbi:MAG: imidazole glycerol phosphate synthase subunit HisH [Candidatus Staskawiczbacteria bacterium]|nr:imidazole glycerol phosphate synthase subunit HisH [Candidatus Staskawiczbacteria bacterium]
MISIVDYDMGNLGSIKNMIKKIGYQSIITNDKMDLMNSDCIILPGVGSFDTGVKNLKKYDLYNYLKDIAKEKKIPILGICLGMQLMCKSSEEGEEIGLGLIDAISVKFADSEKLKIPHMGWSFVQKIRPNILLDDFIESPRFYFVHSYYVKCNDDKDILGITNYGIDFHSAFRKNNVFGVQFHPEKSHKFGITLLKSFLNYVYHRNE